MRLRTVALLAGAAVAYYGYWCARYYVATEIDGHGLPV